MKNFLLSLTTIVLVCFTFLRTTHATPSLSDNSNEYGLSILRTVNVSASIGNAHGIDVDPTTGAVYCLVDENDIYRLETDGSIVAVKKNLSGVFAYDIRSDIRIGSDGQIYLLTTLGSTNSGVVHAFDPSTETTTQFTSGITSDANDGALDFDCAGNLYVGENNTSGLFTDLFIVNSSGINSPFVSDFFIDIDEITSGFNNQIYVQDDGLDDTTIYLVEPNGSVSAWYSGLPDSTNNYSTAFDESTGHLFAASYALSGIVYRVGDFDEDGTIESREFITGFTAGITDIDWGIASDYETTGNYSLYIVDRNEVFYEITGFSAPLATGCGEKIDDDDDGYCENGIDLSDPKDGDCIDTDEQDGSEDCDDTDAAMSPALTEVCGNGVDDDCDGNADLDDADAGCSAFYDDDGDGYCLYGYDSDADRICETDTSTAYDCNDNNILINPAPSTEESCFIVGDEDCNGDSDEEDIACSDYVDDDHDGYCIYGINLSHTVDDHDCLDEEDETYGTIQDCDDTNTEVSPEEFENTVLSCTDTINNDCDDTADTLDSDCSIFIDDDHDGYCEYGEDLPASEDGDCLDIDEQTAASDCDDADNNESPSKSEDSASACADALDNDCDGATDVTEDPSCSDYVDSDADGVCTFGIDLNEDHHCLSSTDEMTNAQDCDDTLSGYTTLSTEICGNGGDDDCDTFIDTDDTNDPSVDCNNTNDTDGDGYCPNGHNLNPLDDQDCDDAGETGDGISSDCDDTDADVYPSDAPESGEACTNGKDDNCDGAVDSRDTGCADYLDDDQDGYCELGSDLSNPVDYDCDDENEQTSITDCNDDNPLESPGLIEICGDTSDNDCDGNADLDDADAGCSAFYDGDDDGYCLYGYDSDGDKNCETDTTTAYDCNDNNELINPGPSTEENCFTVGDEDCNGDSDEEDIACSDYVDDDHDGYCIYGINLSHTVDDHDCLDEEDETYGTIQDCDDTNTEVSPEEFENTVGSCTDTINNDCDDTADTLDSDCSIFIDDDHDGYCEYGEDLPASEDGDCLDADEQTAASDCDDADNNESPSKSEDSASACADALDNDCDGATDVTEDPSCSDYVDSDADGVCTFGIDLNEDHHCLSSTDEMTNAQDCDDTLSGHTTLSIEVCGNGRDDDCDTFIDTDDTNDPSVDCNNTNDTDGDGYCPNGHNLNPLDDQDCDDAGETGDGISSDCDDTDADVYPSDAPESGETCTNGKDDNCDGAVDSRDTGCADYLDDDQDGYCELGSDLSNPVDYDCDDENERTSITDCNDDNALESPANTSEICADEIDNDCDGNADTLDVEDGAACESIIDLDGDHYCAAGYDINFDGICSGDELTLPGDCDDAEILVHPDSEIEASVACTNHKDNDCSGMLDIDEDTCSDYTDSDSDRYCAVGIDEDEDGLCISTGEINETIFDCNDQSDLANPSITIETCDDGLDNDCSGVVDDIEMCHVMNDAGTDDDAGIEEDASTSDDASIEEDASTTDDASIEEDASTTDDASIEEDASTTDDAGHTDVNDGGAIAGGANGCSASPINSQNNFMTFIFISILISIHFIRINRIKL